MKKLFRYLLLSALLGSALHADFDHKLDLDDEGFWGAHYDVPKYSAILLFGAALYEGSDNRFGKTAWQSLDAAIMSQVIAEGLKKMTGRLRPRESDSPYDWNEGGASFPSGHVAGMTALVTPFVLEYRADNPWVHLLWLLPAYEMEGRMKAQAHWQTDVIAGAVVGFASGYWAHGRDYPLLLSLSDDHVFVGLHYRF